MPASRSITFKPTHFIASIFLACSFNSFSHSHTMPDISMESIDAPSEKKIISVPQEMIAGLPESVMFKTLSENHQENLKVIEIEERSLNILGHIAHEKFRRCGGFVAHSSVKEAQEFIEGQFEAQTLLTSYEINNQNAVNQLIPYLSEAFIRETIIKLSSFQNRYYKGEEGVKAAKWIRDHWAKLTSHRSDVRVELFEHQSWDQPSVIAKIAGKTKDAVVVGGHLDSIRQTFWPSSPASMIAPGADDNASGISVITEVLRVIAQSDYVPEKTLLFMGYAGEEKGLLGSKEIASQFKQDGINVVGVMQLDMVNFKGSSKDIYLVGDYTNKELTQFTGKLIDEYLKLPWGYTRCGYACSDHASWTGRGFPAVAPFEAEKSGMNKNLHTPKDTIDISRGNAEHAYKFSKLGLAFVLELDI